MKLLLLALSLLATPALAHDANHPEFNGWYKSLRNPQIHSAVIKDLGCCSYRDCHTTDAELRNGQ
jgi:hypothetical protein